MKDQPRKEEVGKLKAELSRLRERDAATNEILDAISLSRADEKPVFDLILEKAAGLCEAPLAFLTLLEEDGEHFVTPAHFGNARSEFVERLRSFRGQISSTQLTARALRETKVLCIDDIADDDLYRDGDKWRVELVDVEGIRSALLVPLKRDDLVLGVIMFYRREVAPFSDDHVSLAKGFAAQAAIAVENVHQFRELQIRLKREAATTEVLKVVSKSRDDETPVFDLVLKHIAELCEAPIASLHIADWDRNQLNWVAQHGENPVHYQPGQTVFELDSISIPARSVSENRRIHVDDLADTDLYRQGNPIRTTTVDVEGIRTYLSVPLATPERAFGCIALYRRDVKPFSDDEIALVEGFAAQAVIAIENSRQFREVQTRLERETATSEILSVISQSNDNEKPVFDAILKNAARLCEAPLGFLFTVNEERTHYGAVAHIGALSGFMETDAVIHSPLDDELVVGRAINSKTIQQVEDLKDDEPYRQGNPIRVQTVDIGGVRTLLAVPLVRNQIGIGAIGLYRREVSPFSDDQIKLVEAFASQAVIAMDNVRQFKALETLNAELGDRVDEQVGEIERMGKLKRFLPAAVADTVVSQGSEKMLSSHRALLGVLFCDIRGFTAFCETAEPEETIEVLQTYHEEMGKLINKHGAGVDHRMGDGIMVLFNDPIPCEDPAGVAVRLAIAMRSRMVEIASRWKKLGHRLGFGVGISLGYATVGMVGYEGRSDYTASGTAVNLAARLCDRAEDGEILMSPRAYTAVEDDFAGEPTGEIKLKGIREPVEVYRLLTERPINT